jgi:hypothetical protein
MGSRTFSQPNATFERFPARGTDHIRDRPLYGVRYIGAQVNRAVEFRENGSIVSVDRIVDVQTGRNDVNVAVADVHRIGQA